MYVKAASWFVVVVGWSALSNVSDGMTGHNMAERIGHQFDPFGRDLQRHFGWLAFHFFALKVPVDWQQKEKEKRFRLFSTPMSIAAL